MTVQDDTSVAAAPEAAPPADGAPADDAVLDAERRHRAAVVRQLAPPMPRDGLLMWSFALVIAGAAALVRMINLSWPDRLVFDEAYYVPEAEQMLRYGFEENRAYYFIVHPPFGKWNLAIGEWLFGYTPLGWRIAGVTVGVGAVLLLMFVVRRLTRSSFIGLAAGILLAADGFSFALSRTGILDIYLQFWVLLGFVFLVLDRDRFRAQLAEAYAAGTESWSRWGPRLGFRWWRLAAGITFGLACSIKWSGLYFLAIFAILCVWWDVGAYRLVGLRAPYLVALRRSLPTAFWDLGIVPILTYLVSWIGWYAGETAQGRHWAEGRDTAWPWIPEAIRALWHMHVEWWGFHTTLTSPHPWDSHPWSWIVGGRPVLMVNDQYVEAGQNLTRTITMIGTPALWWAFAPALLWAIWRLISRRDWVAGAAIAGIVAGWVVWFIDTERTMFMFYMAPVVPFFIIAVCLALQDVLGKPTDSRERRQIGAGAVAIYLALVIVLFGFFLPVLNGTPLTEAERALRTWLTTWN